MKKHILKEFCTPDGLNMDNLPGNEGNGISWRDSAYPFIGTDEGIVYGEEGEKHSDLKSEIIATLAHVDRYDVEAIEDGNYEYYEDGNPDIEGGDGYEVRNVCYYINQTDNEPNLMIALQIYYQDGSKSSVERFPYTQQDVYDWLESNGVHDDIIKDLTNDIMNKEYTDKVYGDGYWLDVDEEVPESDEPYFAIDGNEVDQETIDDILYWTEGDGQYEITDCTYDFGRIWPNYGEDGETYVSMWLNNRFDDDGNSWEDIDYKDEDSRPIGTFDVKSANEDSWGGGIDCVPNTLSPFDKKLIGEVLDHFGCDYDNSFVCIGNTIISYSDLMSGKKNIKMSAEDMKQMDDEQVKHLLPAEEKWKQTQDFRDFRDEVQGEKLAYRDAEGNRRDDKVPMSMAQYHNMIYGENKSKRHIMENMDDEEMILQHGATPHKEMQDFKPKLKPLIMYKQFKLRLDANGKNETPGVVYPLYVNTEEEGFSGKNSKGLQIGKWYKSGEGECWLDTNNNRLFTKGKGYGTDGNTISKLAYRPGWHLTTTPWGNQRGGGKVVGGPKGTGNNYRFTKNSEVWAKLEICVDINATEKARAKSNTPVDQCLDHLEDNEYYEYRTNSNATKDQTWYIVDKIRIIDILDDDTVDSINDDFYNNISASSGRKINSDPLNYTTDSGDIPYWKMPRENGVRYTKDDLKNMGYEPAEPTKGDWKESKKSKKTIKENMEQNNEFILEWKKWVLKESEALQGGDLNEAGEYHMLANEAYDRYSKDKNVQNEFESKSFGELKTIFENNLSDLFKDKSSIIKEYTKLIKEDKNLMAQHYFFTALENFREGSDAKQYIAEALDLVSKKINYKTINESNQKVNNLLKKYRNKLNREIDEDYAKLCESCNYVLTHKKKISNLNEMNNNLSNIISYTNSHAKPQLAESVNAYKLIDDYNKKFSSMLNEEEKSFVQEIMDAKKGSDNVKQKKLFEKFKGDCLNQINKMISESSDTEKEQLLNIKEQILNKEFCAETLVKDMAKLLEMRDVLMS